MRTEAAKSRMTGAAIGAGVIIAMVLGSFGPVANAVTEPTPPTLTANPNPVAQGSEVVLTVEDCDTEPRLHGERINAGMPALYEFEMTPNGDSWTASFTPDRTHDLWIVAECEGTPSATILLDVDAPTLSFTRSGGLFWRPNDEPGRVFGTDCPPGTVATVVIGRLNGESAFDAGLDELGDWQLEFAPLAPGETIHVNASCGDVTYEPISATRETTTSATPPSPTTSPNDDSSIAPPATPRPSSPNYTG